MATLDEIRQKYPQYSDMSDQQLAQALHEKHYSDIPFEQFASTIGLPTNKPKPNLFRFDSDFQEKTGVGAGTMLMGAAKDMFGSSNSAAMYLAKKANEERPLAAMIDGGAKVVNSPEGPVLQLPSGESYYINDPGLDLVDVTNVAGNIVSMLPAARIARFGGNILSRIGLGALGSGGTDAALQVGFKEEGDSFDPTRTIVAGAGGGAGEVIAPIASKVLSALRSSAGSGNARAADILRRELGIENPTNSQVEAFARGLDEIDAGADPITVLGADEFGFIYTRGQRLPEGPAKFRALSQEEALRQKPDMAGDRLRAVERSNREALERAVTDRVSRFGGANPPRTPVEAVERATERVRTMAAGLGRDVDKAYGAAAATGAKVKGYSVRGLPQQIDEALKGTNIDPDVTPATAATLRGLRERLGRLTDAGTLRPQRDAVGNLMPPAKAPPKDVSLADIDAQRKFISTAFTPSMSPADRRALTVLKGQYDKWMDDAFTNALVSGDETALSSLRNAQSLRAEFGRRFEGTEDVDRFIAQMIEGDRTPDELLNVALGMGNVSKASAARYVARLKLATKDAPDVVAALRAAHLMKLTQGKNGEILGAQAIRNNILDAERNTGYVLRELYEPEQWAQIKRLATSIEPMLPRGDFARSSGTAERLMRMVGSLPFIGRGAEMLGVPVRVAQAEAAVGRLAPRSALAPATGAAVGAESQRK